MADTRKLTVELPAHQVDMIETMIEAGEVPSADAYVAHAIRMDTVDPLLKRDLATAQDQAANNEMVDARTFLGELHDKATARLANEEDGPSLS